MKPKLRDYQEELKFRIVESWQHGFRNVLARAPTGAGKSVILTDLAHLLTTQYQMPVCIAVHRKELVSQLCMTLSSFGLFHNIIASRPTIRGIIAEQRKKFGKQFYSYKSDVTVVSVDTLNSRIEQHRAWANNVQVWIVDEAAHLLAENKWGKLVDHFPNARGLGVTATPQRLDRQGLGRHAKGVFDVMVHGPEVRWLIDQGYLADYEMAFPKVDYEAYLRKAASDHDFTRDAMAEADAQSHIVGDTVDNYLKYCSGKQAIVFAATSVGAIKMEQQFLEKGISAKLLTGETPDAERTKAMDDYREGKIKVLINIDLFDEGLDIPTLDAVIMARPTMSLGKYLQMCLDTETEVLTKRGWLSSKNIHKDDIVAAFNMSNESIEWCDIVNLFERERHENENMFNFSNPHLNFRITGKHDLIVKSRSSTSKNWKKEWVDETLLRKNMVKVPVAGFENVPDAAIKDDEITLLGWFLSDGTIKSASGQIQMTISQSVEHCNYLNEIRETLNRLNVPFSETRIKRKNIYSKYADLIQICVGMIRPKRNFKRWEGKNDLSHLLPWFDKMLPNQYDSLSRRQIEILLDSWNKGDGVKRKNLNYSVKTMSITMGDSEVLADRLQSILVRRGFRCNKSTDKRTERNSQGLIKSSKDLFNLHIKNITYSTIAITESNGKIKHDKSYNRNRIQCETNFKNEKVWCLSNRLGTLITRRSGKVIIMGNCGRVLRPVYAKGYSLETKEGRLAAQAAGTKPKGLIIDQVGNYKRHGRPCLVREWTLDDIVKKREDVKLHKYCDNWQCNAPIERWRTMCPFCGTEVVPKRAGGGGGARVPLAEVDGDLVLVDSKTLRELEGATKLEDPARTYERVLGAAGQAAATKAMKDQSIRIATQKELIEVIAQWSGIQRNHFRLTDREIHKKFYCMYDMSISGALAGTTKEMKTVMEEIITRGMWA